MEKKSGKRFKSLGKFPVPCAEEMKKCYSCWTGGEEERKKYAAQNAALEDLFKRHPENTEKNIVLVKIATLDKFYSTYIFGAAYKIAERIVAIKDMDERLKRGDLTLVDDVADVKGCGVLYSFASKYCSFHRPDVYPIYDSNVCESLRYFCRDATDEDGESALPSKIFKKLALGKNNRDYLRYVSAVNAFIDTFGLKIGGKYDYKKVDAYLWKIGREIKKGCESLG